MLAGVWEFHFTHLGRSMKEGEVGMFRRGRGIERLGKMLLLPPTHTSTHTHIMGVNCLKPYLLISGKVYLNCPVAITSLFLSV